MVRVHTSPPMHPALTSTTRTATSAMNAIAEYMLAGNRFYKTYRDVKDHVRYLSVYINREKVQREIDKGLYVPSHEDLCDIVANSLSRYNVRNTIDNSKLDFLKQLDDVERTWFAYSNDFYHMLKLNKEKLGWLKALSEVVYVPNIDYLKILEEAGEFSAMNVRMAFGHKLIANKKSYKEMYDGTDEERRLVELMGSYVYKFDKMFKDAEFIKNILYGYCSYWSS